MGKSILHRYLHLQNNLIYRKKNGEAVEGKKEKERRRREKKSET